MLSESQTEVLDTNPARHQGLALEARFPAFQNPVSVAWAMTAIFAIGMAASTWHVPVNAEIFLALHSLLELAAVIVSVMIFALWWNIRRQQDIHRVTIVGGAFLAVALIDVAHMLSFPGMPSLVTPSSAEKGINFWLAGRYVATLSLLALAWLPWRRQGYMGPRVSLAGWLGFAAAAWFVGFFHMDWLPRTFIQGSGLTPFKIIAEYILVVLSLVAAWRFSRGAVARQDVVLGWLAAAALVLGYAEMFFTLYQTPTDLMNLSGHVFKAAGYLLIYHALFVMGVNRPYLRLSAARADLEATLQAIPDVLFEMDRSGRLIDYRAASRDTPLVSPETRIGRALGEVMPAGAAAVMLEALQEAADNGLSTGRQFQIGAATGGNGWYELSVARKQPAAGEAPRFVVLARDVTERKQVEQDLKRLNEELEERVALRTIDLAAANKELEAFSYSASHDLRAPLRSIDGFIKIIASDYAARIDDKGKDYLARVEGAVRRMGKLIDDLLKLSRVGRTELVRRRINLSAIARSIEVELREADPARAVSFVIQDGVSVEADAELMRVVLTNLLGNAWKYSSRQTQAVIEFGRMDRNGSEVVFVRDNGAGFDMAYADRLFGAFQRLHSAGEFEGTGIGLATVQRIIHRHGGEIGAEGRVGMGATFYFTLGKGGPAAAGMAGQFDASA
jgi:hypothetical protein